MKNNLNKNKFHFSKAFRLISFALIALNFSSYALDKNIDNIVIKDDVKTSSLAISANDKNSVVYTIDKNATYTITEVLDPNVLKIEGEKNNSATLNVDGTLYLNAKTSSNNVMVLGGENAKHNSILNINGFLYVGTNKKDSDLKFNRNVQLGSYVKQQGLTVNVNGKLHSAELTLVKSTLNLNANGQINAKSINLWLASSLFANANSYAKVDFFNIFNEGKMIVNNGAYIENVKDLGGTIEGLLDIKEKGKVVAKNLFIEKNGVLITNNIGMTQNNTLEVDPYSYVSIKSGGHLALRENTSLNYLKDYLFTDKDGVIAIKGIATMDLDDPKLNLIQDATIIANKFDLKTSDIDGYHLKNDRFISTHGFKDIDNTKKIYTDNSNFVLGLNDLKGYQHEFYGQTQQGSNIENTIITGTGTGNLSVQGGNWDLKSVEIKNNGVFNILGGNTNLHKLKISPNGKINVSSGFLLLEKDIFDKTCVSCKTHKNNILITNMGQVQGNYFDLTNAKANQNIDYKTLKLKDIIDINGNGYLILDKRGYKHTQEEHKILNEQRPKMTITILGEHIYNKDNFPIRNQGILDITFGGQPHNYIDETVEKQHKTDFNVGQIGQQTLAIKEVILKNHKLQIGDANGPESKLTVAQDITRVDGGIKSPIVIDYKSKLNLFDFRPRDTIKRSRNNQMYTVNIPIVGGTHDDNNYLNIIGPYAILEDIGDDIGKLNLSVQKNGHLIANKDVNVSKLEVEGNLKIKGALSLKDNAVFTYGDSHINELKSIKKYFVIDPDANLDSLDKSIYEIFRDTIRDEYVYIKVDSLKTNQNGDANFNIKGSQKNNMRGFLQIKSIEDGDKGINSFVLDDLGALTFGNFGLYALKKANLLSLDHIKEHHKELAKNYEFMRIIGVSTLTNGSKLNLKKNHLYIGIAKHDKASFYLKKDTLFIADFTNIKENEPLIKGSGESYYFEDGSSIYAYGISDKNYKKFILIDNTQNASDNIKNYDNNSKKGVHVISANRLVDLFIEQEDKDLVLKVVYKRDNKILNTLNQNLQSLVIKNENNQFLSSVLNNFNGLEDKEVSKFIDSATKVSLLSGAYNDVIYNSRKSMSLVKDRIYEINNGYAQDLKLDIANRNYNLWTTAMYEHSSIHGYESGSYTYGLKSSLQGVIVGVDSTKDNLTHGVYLSYAKISTHNTGDLNHISKKSKNLGFAYYQNYNFDKYSLGTIFSYNTQSNDIEHDIKINKLYGNFNTNTLNAQLNLNYCFNFDKFALNTFAEANLNYLMAKDLSLYMQDDEVIKNYANNKLFKSIKLGANVSYLFNVFNKEFNVKHSFAFEKTIGSSFFTQGVSIIGSTNDTAYLTSRVVDNNRFTLGSSISYYNGSHNYKFSINNTFSKYKCDFDLVLNYNYTF